MQQLGKCREGKCVENLYRTWFWLLADWTLRKSRNKIEHVEEENQLIRHKENIIFKVLVEIQWGIFNHFWAQDGETFLLLLLASALWSPWNFVPGEQQFFRSMVVKWVSHSHREGIGRNHQPSAAKWIILSAEWCSWIPVFLIHFYYSLFWMPWGLSTSSRGHWAYNKLFLHCLFVCGWPVNFASHFFGIS